VAALPDSFHRDPADRILVATARVQGATLLTQDERIIRSGLVATVG
jgi:PIN domain nuclease of toxin-antitoxin system